MSRLTTTIDRVATVIVALLLICSGALIIIWRYGWWAALPTPSDTSPITSFLQHDWWPWVEAAAGIVLAIIGTRWLWAHLQTRGVKELNLPDAGPDGRGAFNARAVAATAADVLADAPGVKSAKGTVIRDRGQLIVDIKATIDATADLGLIAPAADEVMNDLAGVTNRPDLHGRVHLVATTRTPSSRPRVT